MPLAESRDVRSVRMTAAEWEAFREAATLRDMEPSTLVRECAFIGLNVINVPALLEAYARLTAKAASVLRASYNGVKAATVKAETHLTGGPR